MAINEAKDQHGGQLAFDNGETLNYEGRCRCPTLVTHWSHTNLVLAVCIGSHWPGPLNFPSSREEFNKFVGEWRSRFNGAKDILLVGAGAVGLGMKSSFFSTFLLITVQNWLGS